MLRIIKADKVNWVVTLEMSKRDLENIVESVDSMSDKEQKNFIGKPSIRISRQTEVRLL